MLSTVGVNLRVTGHCNQGGRKYMEDAFVVAYQQTENKKDLEYAFFGIFDGHGGREAALFAKDNLMNFIVNQKNFWSGNDDLVLKAIRDGFITAHLAMWKEVGTWPKTVSGLPSTSGTTSSIAFIRHGKLYVGHVGDSKIVLGYQEHGSGPWLPLSLTKDHKPESPKEKERIYKVGGLVLNKAGVERVVWNRPKLGHKGPVRRSTAFDQIPFLAVARSLGDLWSYNYLLHEFIVSPEPDVSVFPLDTRRHRCIILASDGLWNMISTKNAVCVVQNAEEENEQIILESGHVNGNTKQANNPSRMLVDRALHQWHNLRMRADNTSVVTVLLDPQGPSKSKVLLRQKVMQKLRPRDEQVDTDIQISGTYDRDYCEIKCQKKQGVDIKYGKIPDDYVVPKDKKKHSIRGFRLPNLPQPVIISPHRVSHKLPSSHEKQKSPSVKKIAEKDVEGTVAPVSEHSFDSTTEPQDKTSQDLLVIKDKKDQCKILSSGSKCNMTTTKKSQSAKDETNGKVSQLDTSSFVNENDQNLLGDSSRSSGADSNKESGRMRLSVVNNIVKDENADSRTELNKPVLRTQENKSSVADGMLRKLPGSSRTSSVQKRRNQDGGESSTPSKNLRLGSGRWSRDVLSNCAVANARDLAITRNTRSQQRLRKVKVR